MKDSEEFQVREAVEADLFHILSALSNPKVFSRVYWNLPIKSISEARELIFDDRASSKVRYFSCFSADGTEYFGGCRTVELNEAHIEFNFWIQPEFSSREASIVHSMLLGVFGTSNGSFDGNTIISYAYNDTLSYEDLDFQKGELSHIVLPDGSAIQVWRYFLPVSNLSQCQPRAVA